MYKCYFCSSTVVVAQKEVIIKKSDMFHLTKFANVFVCKNCIEKEN